VLQHLERATLLPGSATGDRQHQHGYHSVQGEIPKGYDLEVLHEATLAAAKERCTEDPRCQGLSFAAAVADTKRALEITLKTSRIVGARPGYWSWMKPIATDVPRKQASAPLLATTPDEGTMLLSQPAKLEITLVTQTSVDRIWMLKKLCELWPGPVSAAVFVVGNQMADVAADMERSACARNGHVAYVQGKHSDNYPVNVLRNKARQWVTTSHWLNTDVDLWPSDQTHSVLLRLLRQEWALGAKTAIVVPAFATRHKDMKRMPANLEALAKCIGRRECYSFKGYPGAIPAHHLSTNYPYWWYQTTRRIDPKDTYKIPCFDTMVYEPYTLLPNKASTPPFDERFTGYGKNKIQFIQHLRMLGFQFFVAPKCFLMHAYHAKSNARHEWRHHKVAMDKLFGQFVNEMSRIRDPNALPLCTERLPQFTTILKYNGDNRAATPVQSGGAADGEEDEDMDAEAN